MRCRLHSCSDPSRAQSSRVRAGSARFAGLVPGAGKRGGFRVIYFWDAKSSSFYMLYVYPKNEQGDLTAAQVRVLGALVREEFK